MILQLLEQLDTEVCPEAVDWLEENQGFSFEELWEKCERADWMLWFCAQIGVHHKSLISAAIDCTERALKYIPEKEKRLDAVFADLRLWLKGDIDDLEDASYFAELVCEELLTDPFTVRAPTKSTMTDAYYEASLAIDYLKDAADEGPGGDYPNIFIEMIDALSCAYAYAETSEMAVAVDIGTEMDIYEVAEDDQIAYSAIYEFSKTDELKALADVIRKTIVWTELQYKVAVMEYKHFGKLQ